MLGFDFLYASENLLNCIHGPRESVADAWSILAAIGAVTSKVGLCGAVKPGFRSPFLVARMLDTMSKISERRMGMNIVCGWWKEEFDLSGVDWLDHDGRYDRASEFLRSLYGLFQPPAEVSNSTVNGAGSPQEIGIEPPPSYGLDQNALPEIWIAGHSDRAVQMAAEWGHCLFLNGMSDAELKRRIEAVRQEANSWGRKVLVAANAYVIATEAGDQARQRWKSRLVWRDENDTQAFAAALSAQPGIGNLFIALQGKLGAGKTTLVRHLLRALGVTGRIKSPTYAVVEPHQVEWYRDEPGFRVLWFSRFQSGAMVARNRQLDLAGVGQELGTLLGGGYVNRFNYFDRSYKVIPQIGAAEEIECEHAGWGIPEKEGKAAADAQATRKRRPVDDGGPAWREDMRLPCPAKPFRVLAALTRS